MRRGAHPAGRLRPRLLRLRRGLRSLWRALRALSGDDAYERYCRHAAACHPGQPLMTRRAFFDELQRRRWSGVNRCC